MPERDMPETLTPAQVNRLRRMGVPEQLPDVITAEDMQLVQEVIPEFTGWKAKHLLEIADIPLKPLHLAKKQVRAALEKIGGPFVEEPEVPVSYTVPEAPPGVLPETTAGKVPSLAKTLPEAAELAAIPAYFRGLGKIVGAAGSLAKTRKAEPIIELTEEVTEIAQPAEHWAKTIKPKMPTAKELSPAKALSIGQTEQVTAKAIERAIADPENPIVIDKVTRLFRNIAEDIDVNPEHWMEVFGRYGYTPEQFAQDFIRTHSFAGKSLNRLSQLRKQLDKVLGQVEGAQPFLEKMAKTDPQAANALIRMRELFRWADNKRRMLMVSQLATAARNAISQGARTGINLLDDAVTGVYEYIGGAPAREAFADMMGDFAGIYNRFSKTKRQQLNSLLNAYPLDSARLLGAPVHDAAIGSKFDRFVMFFNRSQEYFYRKMIFDARLTSWAKKLGTNWTKDVIPDNVLEDAIKTALEVTWADPARSQMGKLLMRAYHEAPFLTLFQPYPRFWLNSLRFLWDFNPTGFLTAATRTKMLGGPGGKVVSQALSRATLGSMMLGGGFAFRMSPYAGEKWYEMVTPWNPDKRIDLRAFAPFVQYAFLAEWMLHPEKISAYDRVQGLVGINRIAGSGLIIFDMLSKDQKPETTFRQLKEIMGGWLGGFTVPFRTIKDFAAALEPSEAEVQNTRENPVVGPAIQNLPWVSQRVLPQAPRLTRKEPYVREQTVLRQLTGLTIKTKTELEKEIHRLNVQRIYPYTGDQKLDRLIVKGMGPIVERHAGLLVRSLKYQNADDETKKEMLKDKISKIKSDVRNQLLIPHFSTELDKLKGSEEKKDYILDLIDRNKLSKKNARLLLRKRGRDLSVEDRRTILKKIQ